MELFLSALGLFLVIEGLPYFAFPKTMKLVLEQVINMPDSTLQKMGLFMIASGLIFVYCIKFL